MEIRAIRKVGVVGCGLIGGGIAQTCAQVGYETLVREINPPLLVDLLPMPEGQGILSLTREPSCFTEGCL